MFVVLTCILSRKPRHLSRHSQSRKSLVLNNKHGRVSVIVNQATQTTSMTGGRAQFINSVINETASCHYLTSLTDFSIFFNFLGGGGLLSKNNFWKNKNNYLDLYSKCVIFKKFKF